MTTDDTTRLRALAEAAHPGPWLQGGPWLSAADPYPPAVGEYKYRAKRCLADQETGAE
jgi:hypothetical protein